MTFIRSLITVSLFIAFIGVWIWAWRAERRADFAEAARLPLESDTEPLPLESETERLPLESDAERLPLESDAERLPLESDAESDAHSERRAS